MNSINGFRRKPKKNRYSSLYGLLQVLAKAKGWGDERLGMMIAERKLRKQYNIVSFRQLSEKDIDSLKQAILSYKTFGKWPELQLEIMEETFNKVQINRTVRFGVDPRTGRRNSQTDEMLNIRTNDVAEAVKLYFELQDAIQKERAGRKAAQQ